MTCSIYLCRVRQVLRFTQRTLPVNSNLPKSEWEVALSSISFPSSLDVMVHKNVDFQKLADVDFLCGMELEMDGVKNHKKLEIGSQSYWLRGSVLKYELLQALPIHGGDFWNSMLSLLNRRLHGKLPLKMNDYIVEDRTYQKKRPKWPVFFWEDVGCGSYRLCIDNSGIGGSYIAGIENEFYIHLDVAKAFKLVIPKEGVQAHQNRYELTSLLTFEHLEILSVKSIITEMYKESGKSWIPKRFNLNLKGILANPNSYVYSVPSIGSSIDCVKSIQVRSRPVNPIKNDPCTSIRIWYKHKSWVVQKRIY